VRTAEAGKKMLICLGKRPREDLRVKGGITLDLKGTGYEGRTVLQWFRGPVSLPYRHQKPFDLL
jgi:hypothetical protein